MTSIHNVNPASPILVLTIKKAGIYRLLSLMIVETDYALFLEATDHTEPTRVIIPPNTS